MDKSGPPREHQIVQYFAQLLTHKGHPLRFPKEHSNEVQGYVRQHQTASPERAPFRRQLDFWAFSITTAVAQGIPPLEQPSSKWGRRYTDTRSVIFAEPLASLLVVIAFHHLGPKHEGIDDPAQIIEINNRLAGAGCPIVLDHLRSLDLRLTPLEKALTLAASMFIRDPSDTD